MSCIQGILVVDVVVQAELNDFPQNLVVRAHQIRVEKVLLREFREGLSSLQARVASLPSNVSKPLVLNLA